MSSDESVDAFGPQGHDPTVRKKIPIKREQISQSELAVLLETATRESKYSSTSFAWRDGTTSMVSERLVKPDGEGEATAASRVRDFHQLEELNGVITQSAFEDDSTLWLVVGDFSDVNPSVSSSAEKQPSIAQHRAYEIRTLTEGFKGAPKFPGRRRLRVVAVALAIAVGIFLLALSLLINRQEFSWLSIVPALLTWLAAFIFPRYLLFQRPSRPFLVSHLINAKPRLNRVPDWLQVILAIISLAVAVWAIYLTYRPPS